MFRSLYTRGLMAAGAVAVLSPGPLAAFHDAAREEVKIAKVCCPTIVGNCFGYHQTKWRVMGPCTDDSGRSCGAAATLPPVMLPTAPMVEPAPKPAPMPIPKVVDPLPKVIDPVPKSKVKAEPIKSEAIPSKLILPPDLASSVVAPPLPSGYGLKTEAAPVKKAAGFADSR